MSAKVVPASSRKRFVSRKFAVERCAVVGGRVWFPRQVPKMEAMYTMILQQKWTYDISPYINFPLKA